MTLKSSKLMVYAEEQLLHFHKGMCYNCRSKEKEQFTVLFCFLTFMIQ